VIGVSKFQCIKCKLQHILTTGVFGFGSFQNRKTALTTLNTSQSAKEVLQNIHPFGTL